ncbi:hypothetical protein HY624_01990, partial [Candidatus Uhrbacteria bacterium]|nr:hypothetical protein [Candidatus Uhrbacteria bacterium]
MITIRHALARCLNNIDVVQARKEQAMSANSVCGKGIGYHQGGELLHALEKEGLTPDIAQGIVASPGNGKAKAMMAAILSSEAASAKQKASPQQCDPFVLVTSFPVVVPANYDHATRLATFRREHGSEFAYYNGDITDEHFVRATTRLVPGRKFSVKVFQITRRVSSEDCLALLAREQGVLVGAAGATLAYEQGKGQLPKGRWHISFDEKEALWEDASGLHRVPLVGAYADGS